MQENITNRIVNGLEVKNKPYEVRDTGLKGLLLRVQPSGVMTYYLEFKRGKRTKVGRADAITPFQARELGRKVLSEVYGGADPTERKPNGQEDTYIEFLESIYKRFLEKNLRTGKKTYDRLKINFPELHDLKLSEISPFVIEKWRLRRIENWIKPSSINRELADLRSCLSRATQWEVIPINPLTKVKPCKIDKNPKVRFLSIEEEAKLRKVLDEREQALIAARQTANEWRQERGYPLYADLDNVAFVDHLKPAILLSLNLGVRRGELFSLKWHDIDFNQKNVTITASSAKAGQSRHIPLNPEAFEILHKWKEQPGVKSQYVFTGKDGKPFFDLKTAWKNILNKAEIKNFRWHDLRHSFASKLVMENVNLNVIRELLGHSSYQMTLKYSHLSPGAKVDAVNRLVAAVG